MTVSEKIVLREDVARPADRAAASVERLAGALGGLGKAQVDSGAAARIERAARAASKAEGRASEAAGKAAALREKASTAEDKAQKAAERAAKLRADGIEAEKADVAAQKAAATAARRKASAQRAEEIATKRQAVAEKQRAAASKVHRAAEDAAEKKAAKARKDAAREEVRKKKGLTPKVGKSEARLQEALQRFNPAQERREALLERQIREAKRQARAGIDGNDADGRGGAFGGAGGRAAAAAALAAAGAAVATAAGRAALDLGKAAVDAAAFREDATRALNILRRAQGDADRVMRSAMITADFIGQGRQETLGQYVELLGKGFDPVMVNRIVRSMADLGTVNREANVDGIIRAVAKIKAQGYLQGDELSMLTEAGLPAEDVYARVAANLGKTTDEIRRMQGARKLDWATTLEGVLGAINQLSGGSAPGLAARAKSLEDITGLLGRLRALPGNLLMDLNVTPGMQNFKGFVGGVLDSLDPAGPRWQRITTVLGKLLNSLFGAVFEGTDPGTFIDRILGKVEQAEPLISAAISGFKTGFGFVLRIFEKLDEVTGGGPFAKMMELLGLDDVPWIELIARGVGLIAGALGLGLALVGVAGAMWAGFAGTVYGAVLSAYGAVAWFAESVWSWLSADSMRSEGTSLGGAIVEGLVAGLMGGALVVATAAKALAGGTISSARSALGIASPSRVFAGIGGDVASGAEVGITGGAGRVIRAAEAMALGAARAANDNVLTPRAAGVLPGAAAGALGAGVRAGASATRANGAGVAYNFGSVSVQITVQGGGTEADGAAVARGLWDELRRIAEEVA